MYKRERKSWVKHLDFTILDIVCLEIAFIVAYMLRLGLHAGWLITEYQRMAIMLILLDICVVFFFESYKGILRRNKYQELQSSFLHCSLVFVGIVVYMFAVQRSALFSRQVLFTYWALSILLTFSFRVVLKKIVRSRIVNDKNRSVMILVTTDAQLEECLSDFKKMEYTEFEIKGIVIIDKVRTGEVIGGIPVVAGADDFYAYMQENVVDEVFLNGNTIESSEALSDELLEMGITVHYNLVHESKMMPNRVIEPFGSFVVMTSSMRIATPRELLVKRIFDIIGGIVGLIFTGIIFVIFAPIIKKQSPGPIFFSQIRIGKNGRRFKFYKFRSMYPDAEERKKELLTQNEMSGIMFKMKDDPRIFPIGRFMRRLSLDEFPQFWNVLKGDMSLVGPRPERPQYVEKFREEIPRYMIKHQVRPGMTGWAQVNGLRGDTSIRKRIDLDLFYIENWSVSFDIRILFLTVFKGFVNKNAY